MFALAIWDALARRLILARDRLGVKPLYYAELPGVGLVFGSELKALLEDPDVPREWRADAIDAYLTMLYIPAPATIYRGISKKERGRMAHDSSGSTMAASRCKKSFLGWNLKSLTMRGCEECGIQIVICGC